MWIWNCFVIFDIEEILISSLISSLMISVNVLTLFGINQNPLNPFNIYLQSSLDDFILYFLYMKSVSLIIHIISLAYFIWLWSKVSNTLSHTWGPKLNWWYQMMQFKISEWKIWLKNAILNFHLVTVFIT